MIFTTRFLDMISKFVLGRILILIKLILEEIRLFLWRDEMKKFKLHLFPNIIQGVLSVPVLFLESTLYRSG